MHSTDNLHRLNFRILSSCVILSFW